MMRQEFLEHLHNGISRVTFRKVTNGRWKVLYCTLNPEIIPHIEKGRLELSEMWSMRRNPNLMVVWDVVHNEWRSFYDYTVFKFIPDVEKFQSDTDGVIIQ